MKERNIEDAVGRQLLQHGKCNRKKGGRELDTYARSACKDGPQNLHQIRKVRMCEVWGTVINGFDQ